MRVHVERNEHPTNEVLEHELDNVEKLVREKLESIAEAEKRQKITIIRFELEKLLVQPTDEEQLVKIEEQLQQLPMTDESTLALSAQVQQIRSDKEKREELKNTLLKKLSDVSQHLDQLDSNVRPIITAAKGGDKKNKGKKQPISLPDRDQQIEELSGTQSTIEHELLPQLENISHQAREQLIQLPTLESEHDKVQKLADEIKVNAYKLNCKAS